jgi:hypothetical protein
VSQLGHEHLALLTERAGDERDVSTAGDVLRHGCAVADRLVVGMRVDEEHASR